MSHEALSAVLSAALGKKGRTPYKYPSQPYSAAEAPQEATDDDRDALRAKIYMRQMMRAGKTLGNTTKRQVIKCQLTLTNFKFKLKLTARKQDQLLTV